VAADIDIAFSHARFRETPEGENYVPGALNRVISGGVAINPPAGVSQGPFGGFRLRHFGPRSLIEDNSVKSKSTWIVNAEVGYKFSDRLRLTLESYNIFDVEASDIDYYFESRLQGEPEAVEDIHFHAAIPRSARLALHMSF
jgi:outer membrane receptor protein involved in Fe transport